MNDEVQFDVDAVPPPHYKTKESKFVTWTIKYSHGLIKDEEQANYFLIGSSVLMLLISLFLFL